MLHVEHKRYTSSAFLQLIGSSRIRSVPLVWFSRGVDSLKSSTLRPSEPTLVTIGRHKVVKRIH